MVGDRPITEVPDIVGLGATDACDIIRAAGLIPVGPNETGPPRYGTVTAQRPIGNAGAERGSQVMLWTGPGKHANEPLQADHDAADLDPV